ncbi:MAG: hypothetical protein DDT19_02033 [Syntrophomonadaceae bacterium]|nr:hypothetical protein [Bacillota bacterium]
MKTKTMLVVFISLLWVSSSYAVLDTGGNRSISARVDALGGAFVGDASDISSLMYNPGGASQLKGQNIILTHQKIFGGMAQFSYIGMGSYVAPNRHIGFSYSRFEPSEDELYPAKEQKLSFSYGQRLGNQLFWGATLRYITTTENWIGGNAKGRGYGMDTGLVYHIVEKIKLGIAISDLISSMSYSGRQGSDVFETRVTFGTSYKIDETAKIFLDIKDPFPFDNQIPKKSENEKLKMSINIGVEKCVDEAIALRAGYNGQEKKFTYGVGIVMGPWNVDYAYSPTKGDVLMSPDNPNRISIRMKLR